MTEEYEVHALRKPSWVDCHHRLRRFDPSICIITVITVKSPFFVTERLSIPICSYKGGGPAQLIATFMDGEPCIFLAGWGQRSWGLSTPRDSEEGEIIAVQGKCEKYLH